MIVVSMDGGLPLEVAACAEAPLGVVQLAIILRTCEHDLYSLLKHSL